MPTSVAEAADKVVRQVGIRAGRGIRPEPWETTRRTDVLPTF